MVLSRRAKLALGLAAKKHANYFSAAGSELSRKADGADLSDEEKAALSCAAWALWAEHVPAKDRKSAHGRAYRYPRPKPEEVESGWYAGVDANAAYCESRHNLVFAARFYDVLWDTKDVCRPRVPLPHRPDHYASCAARAYGVIAYENTQEFLAGTALEPFDAGIQRAFVYWERCVDLALTVRDDAVLAQYLPILRSSIDEMIAKEITKHPHYALALIETEILFWTRVMSDRRKYRQYLDDNLIEECLSNLEKIDRHLLHSECQRLEMLESKVRMLRWLGRSLDDKELAKLRAQVYLDAGDHISPMAATMGHYREAQHICQQAGLREMERNIGERLRRMEEEGRESNYGIPMHTFRLECDYEPILAAVVEPIEQALESAPPQSDAIADCVDLMNRNLLGCWEGCLEAGEQQPGSVFAIPGIGSRLNVRDGRVLKAGEIDSVDERFLRNVGLFLPAVQAALDVFRHERVSDRAPRSLAELVTDDEDLKLSIENAFRLYYGGNYEASLHLAIPKLEALLRNILRDRGETVVAMDRSGNQRNLPLDELMPLAGKRFLPRFMVRLLQLTLSQEGRGWNLRHDVAHGMIGHGDCTSYTAAFVLHLLLVIPQLAREQNSTPPNLEAP